MKKVWSIYSPQGRLIEQQEKDTKILEKKDTKENASVGDTIKTALEANIEPLPEEIPFTLANYNKLFRRGVKTPIETVKMGEHQFEKFSEVNGGARKVLLAPAYQTLKDPAFIGKDENGAKLYCKEFSRENKKDKIIVSVVIDKDDSHISISNHIERLEQIQKKCRQGLYVKTTQNLDGNRREGPNNEGEVHDNDESVRQDDATHNSIIDNNTKMSSKKMDFPISYKDFLDNIDEATRKKIDNKVAKTDEENGWGISDEMGYELIDRGKVAIKDNDWATLYEIFSILEDCNFHPEAKAVLEGDFSVMEATLLSDNSYTIHVDNNGYTILEPPPQTEQEKHDNRSEAMLGNQNARKAFSMLSDILQGKKEIIAHKTLGDISIEAGETGKSGWGLKHIIEQRAIKDSRNADEIVAMIPFILDAVKDGKITRQNDRIYELEKDGFFAIIRKDMDGKKEKWVLTGFDDWKKEKEATDAIKTVIDTYGYTPEFSSFRNQVGAVIDSITQQKKQ